MKHIIIIFFFITSQHSILLSYPILYIQHEEELRSATPPLVFLLFLVRPNLSFTYKEQGESREYCRYVQECRSVWCPRCYQGILCFGAYRDAYKKLALRWHPDRCSAASVQEESKEKFQVIQHAYSVLSDTNKRFMYDVGAYDSDNDENGMGDFLKEMGVMMSQIKKPRGTYELHGKLSDKSCCSVNSPPMATPPSFDGGPTPPPHMSASLSPPPVTDMTCICFRDQLWLNSYPFDRNLVFDYFALSPFYDWSCNNEQIRIRSIHPPDLFHLTKMTGIEYSLSEVMEPHLFVIRKQKRDVPDKVTHMLTYYILDGSIYQAPQLCNIFASRIVVILYYWVGEGTLYYVSKAFTTAALKLEKIGYYEAEDENQPADSKSSKEKIDIKEVRRIDHILASLQRKLPHAPPPPAFPEGYNPLTTETEKPSETQQFAGEAIPSVDPIIDQGPSKRMKMYPSNPHYNFGSPKSKLVADCTHKCRIRSSMGLQLQLHDLLQWLVRS